MEAGWCSGYIHWNEMHLLLTTGPWTSHKYSVPWCLVHSNFANLRYVINVVWSLKEE